MSGPVGARLGPVQLLPGVTRGNALGFLLADYATIGFVAFFTVAQTYVLNVDLGIPDSRQGTLSGDLHLLSEIIIIALSAAAGALADQVGRRIVFAGGIAVLGLAYIGLPLAGAEADLWLWRIVYALGVTAASCMLTVVVHDYPLETSRGKFVAASGIFGGLGAATVPAMGRLLPQKFEAAGTSPIAAVDQTIWIAGAICIVVAVVVYLTLHRGVPGRHDRRPPLRELIAASLTAGRNSRIALAYGSAFAARGDLVISATFLVLWGTQAGKAAGLAPAAAVSRGTLLFVMATGMSLVAAGIMGALMDRIDRVTSLAISTALAAVGFIGVGLLADPLAPAALPMILLMGFSQAACLFSSQTLIGQEAPMDQRGAVIGAFSTCGAVGVLLASGIGGRLFDQVGPGAPFVMVGAAAAVICLWSLVVRQGSQRQEVS